MKIKDLIKSGPQILSKPSRFLYNQIPIKFKLSKRYKQIYNETKIFLDKSQWWDKSDQENYQLQEILKLLKHAYDTVPYYRSLFLTNEIKISQIQNFDDLKTIPYLTKEIIQKNHESLISKIYNKNKLSWVTTGGSTGIPLGFYIDNDYEIARENAFIDMLYYRIGYRNGMKTIILRGNVSDAINEKEKIFFKNNRSTNELIASAYHLSYKNIIYYLKAARNFNPICIKAYPSSLYQLSSYMIANNEDVFTNVKYIILASENIYKHQRVLFQAIFPNAKIFSFYGHTEHACLAGECEINEFYHIQSEYGYTELINNSDKIAAKEDELGEVTATSFNNYSMPFIRYKTSDIGINTSSNCSCGRHYKLIKSIHGREQEYIITSDNSKISLGTLNHFLLFGKIQKIQIEQNEIGKILIRIIENQKLNSQDILEMTSKIIKHSHGKLDIEVNVVNSIKPTDRGKHKLLIQNIKSE